MTSQNKITSLATIPAWIFGAEGNAAGANPQQNLGAPANARTQREVLSFIGGILGLALLAQIQIPLPWTPVPVTGQTFGVAFISLLFGRNRAFTVVATYLILGGVGLPFFATASNFGLNLSPTLGYLIGMLAASFLVGELSDRGWAKGFWTAYLAAQMGSVLVFTFGLLVLSLFVAGDALLMAGLWPFIPGDLVKNALAARIATWTQPSN